MTTHYYKSSLGGLHGLLMEILSDMPKRHEKGFQKLQILLDCCMRGVDCMGLLSSTPMALPTHPPQNGSKVCQGRKQRLCFVLQGERTFLSNRCGLRPLSEIRMKCLKFQGSENSTVPTELGKKSRLHQTRRLSSLFGLMTLALAVEVHAFLIFLHILKMYMSVRVTMHLLSVCYVNGRLHLRKQG